MTGIVSTDGESKALLRVAEMADGRVFSFRPAPNTPGAFLAVEHDEFWAWVQCDSKLPFEFVDVKDFRVVAKDRLPRLTDAEAIVAYEKLLSTVAARFPQEEVMAAVRAQYPQDFVRRRIDDAGQTPKSIAADIIRVIRRLVRS